MSPSIHPSFDPFLKMYRFFLGSFQTGLFGATVAILLDIIYIPEASESPETSKVKHSFPETFYITVKTCSVNEWHIS